MKIRLFALLTALLLAFGLLCACTPTENPNPENPDDKPVEDTRTDYSAEAGNALTLIETALSDTTFDLTRTTASATTHVVSSGKSFFFRTESEDGVESTLWQYGDEIHCMLYVYDGVDDIWKKYQTSTSEHEWNITRPRASYVPLLEEMHTALLTKSATADSKGYYVFRFSDGDVTMYVTNDTVCFSGEVGVYGGNFVLSQCGTAKTVVTEEMENATQYEYIHSQK